MTDEPDITDALSPFAALAKRIETHDTPDGVVVDLIMGAEAPKTFRVVSVTPARPVDFKMPVVEVKPPWISAAR